MLTVMTIFAISVVGAETTGAEKGPLVIENESLSASFDQSSGSLTLRDLASGRVFVPDAKLTGTNAAGSVSRVESSISGTGKAIELTYSDGNRDIVMLFPDLPFVLLQTGLHNGGADAKTVNRTVTFTATLDLGKPASELAVVGTGGRRRAVDPVGSHEWIAVAEPGTRHGVVAGLLTHDRSTGVFFTKEENGKVNLTARCDSGRLRIHPGKTEMLEILAVGWFDDARLGLEAWADAVAKVYDIHLPPMLEGYCTWYHAGASNENDVVRDSKIAAEKLGPFGFDFMQIDDGWQDGISKNGPLKNFTRVRKDGPYPGGMKATADAISATGLIPGIWFMPFSGTSEDPHYKDHPDWFIKRADGSPYEANWSGTLLDMTNPEVQSYLREEVARIGKEWGYRYFKMDGLHSGTGTIQTYPRMDYAEDEFGDAVFQNPDKTNIEAYRDGLKLVRETAGKDVFILGCCCPQNMRSYGGTFGLVDAMRIGPDNGGNWGGWLTSPRACTVHYFLNGRIWYNDPDPVYVNDKLTLDQARAACSWQAVTGSLTVFSDSIIGLSDDRIDILRRIMPTHGATARPVDLFEADVSRIWLVTDDSRTPRRDVVALFNWTDGPVRCEYAMDYIGLSADTSYAAYDYWSGEFLTIKGSLDLPVAPTSCRILAVRPLIETPMVLSTSRHVMQGMVDLVEEKWAPRSKTLTGKSLVVAEDPYELRIVAISPKLKWKIQSASVSKADEKNGVTIVADKGSDGLWRVTVHSPVSREVAWLVEFTGE